MINEGEEPENFFWVGIGGKKPYEKVSWLWVTFITHLIITRMINEGEEPENFFWVGIGGKKPYEKVC